MTFTSPRATLEETLAFANAVREAGGGSPLDALMPAVPSDSSQCLIAKNLNFNSHVDGISARTDYLTGEAHGYVENTWIMIFENQELRDKVANALGLPIVNDWRWDSVHSSTDYTRLDKKRYQDVKVPRWAMVLPTEIGQVAEDFDAWANIIEARYIRQDDGSYRFEYYLDEDASPEEIERMRTFAPYVQESEREAYRNGVFNDKGELIL